MRVGKTHSNVCFQIFENFKKENPKILDKVQAIAGDIGARKLGLSEEDERKLEQQVHVIFHIAAILKLDANLKDAVNMNTTGTLHLLQLATRMQKLQVKEIIYIHLQLWKMKIIIICH